MDKADWMSSSPTLQRKTRHAGQRVHRMGFTLAELMVVIVIIGVLAAIALPAYNNYAVKSKFTEVVSATNPTKTAIAACAADGSCVINSALNLTGSGSLTPSLAFDGPSTTNALAVMIAYDQAYSTVHNLGWTSSQVASQAATNLAAGQHVLVNPSAPSQVGQQVNGGDDDEGVSLAQLTANYIANGNATMSLPCVGGTGCAPGTKYAASVAYNGVGVITATATSRSGLNAETFVLTPSYSSGRVDWVSSGSRKTRSGGALC